MDNKQYQQLASEFIDLWQKQLGHMVTDKQFIDTMFASLQQMSNYATPGNYESTTPSTPAASSLNDVTERISELDFRLRMAEERINKLESERSATKSAKPAAKRSAKRSTKKVSKPTKSS